MSTAYINNKEFYNKLSDEVIQFCKKNKKEYHIKNGTKTN